MPVIPGPVVPLPNAPIPGSQQNLTYAGLVWSTTLENETLGEVFTGGLGNASFDGTRTHSGAQAVKITQTGTSSQSTRNVPPSSIYVGRFWFNPDTITPTASQNMVIISNPLVTLVPTLRMSTAGVLQAGFATATFQNGPTALLNTWQSIDFLIDMANTPHTLDWMVNGVAQTQAVTSATARNDETMILFRLNSAGNNTLDFWYDDFQLSTDSGAYPLADLPAGAGTAYTDSGTIPVTISLSGADALASADAGTIPVTLTLSGADAVASTDSGTIPLTISLSGADVAASTDAGTIPLTLVLSGADAVASADSGTVPLTVSLSGADAVASADAGTIPLVLVLSGTNTLSSVDAGTIPLVILMAGGEVFGPSVVLPFRDSKDKTPQLLLIP